MRVRVRIIATALVAAGLLVGTAQPTLAAACTGDCNGNGVVSASELTAIVARILICDGTPTGNCGPMAVPNCTSADKNGNGTISAGELTNSSFNALVGCAPQETATPSPSIAATPTDTSAPVATVTSTLAPPATATSTRTQAATATPTPLRNCGNGFLDDSETCELCPADCIVKACTASAVIRTVTVNFAPPAGQDASSVTALVGYRSERVSLPGSGAVSSRVKNRPTNSIVATNDLDYALRVVVTKSSQIPAGRLFTVDFDSCQGAPVPTAADFGCIMQGCASSFGTVDGCTCTVAGP